MKTWKNIINARSCDLRWLALSLLPLAAACDPAVSDGTKDGEPIDVGAEGAVCGQRGGAPCATGLFCDFELAAACGAADVAGTCEVVPEACTEEYAPVCGCDNKTYSNACTAHGARVAVAANGACDAPSTASCGGLDGLTCDAGTFCNFAPATRCGSGDQAGRCDPIPMACDTDLNPVCGCDGKTYSNACEANRHGISVATTGECGAPPSACGGKTGLRCAIDFFCNYAPEDICGAADALGTCAPVPTSCPREEAPVCGCDGVTYSNECTANAASISAASTGACPSM